MSELLTSAEAAARLGIKRETIYAYVSRGVLTRQRDGRTSYFRADEVERLLHEGRRPSLNEFGKTSRLSTLNTGVLHYRGIPIPELLDEPFESVANFLWTGQWEDDVKWAANPDLSQVGRQVVSLLPDPKIASDQLRLVLAAVTAADPFRSDTSTSAAVPAAGTLLRTLVEAMPLRSAEVSEQIPAVLWSRLSTITPSEDHLTLMNAAMVSLADHGLSPSTHAAQIAASARADLYGVLAAGLGVGSGAVLGASATTVEAMLGTFEDLDGTRFALSARLRDEGRLPGFGHPQYPQGDLRARYLLRRLKHLAPSSQRLQRSFEVLELLRNRRLPFPNAFLALGVIADSFDMLPGASEVIFGVSRAAGWIAHAIDEYETGTILRLRESNSAD